MAFVQTADETASLLKLLRHRGGSVDRKLFEVVDFSSIGQYAMRKVEVLAKIRPNSANLF